MMHWEVTFDAVHVKPCALFCFVQVLELNLDNCRTTGQVEGLTENFVNLDYLSLNNAGLTSLKNFPKLPNLRRVSTVLSIHLIPCFLLLFQNTSLFAEILSKCDEISQICSLIVVYLLCFCHSSNSAIIAYRPDCIICKVFKS